MATDISARKINEEFPDRLREIVPHAKIVWIDEVTNGATETALKAEQLIDLDDELIVTNCDQFLDWDRSILH